jgi:hypothetical protein
MYNYKNLQFQLFLKQTMSTMMSEFLWPLKIVYIFHMFLPFAFLSNKYIVEDLSMQKKTPILVLFFYIHRILRQ